jgi:hypothetical protein
MPQLPTPDAYNDAVQTPRAAFTDQLLANGQVDCNGFGIPKALGGGFAITYRVRVTNKSYAVRCFHKEAKDLQERYRRIHGCISSARDGVFVGFEYQPTGIRVRGGTFPIVKMDWVTGDTLGTFVEKNAGDTARINWLRGQFTTLNQRLTTLGVAHGDLQNGNVIVEVNAIKLVDYDGMYVPGMAHGGGTELGHKHFQHPGRGSTHFGPDIDRFSFIAIDLSLWALTLKPSLFKQFSTGENILFTANDYADPDASALFQTLAQQTDPQFTAAVANFAAICKSDIRQTPTLADFLAGQNIPAVAAPPVVTPPSTSRYIGALPIVDASDYAAVCKSIGDRVELVGQIVEIRNDRARKGGKPYAFINFHRYRNGGKFVRVTIWSEGLAALGFTPDETLQGKWVSINGLVDPVYHSTAGGRFKNINYHAVGITLSDRAQFHEITEQEAAWRLGKVAKPTGGKSTKPPPAAVSQANDDILKGLKGKGKPKATGGAWPPSSKPTPKPVTPAAPRGNTAAPQQPTTVKDRNEQLLKSIQAQSAPTPPPPVTTPATQPTKAQDNTGCIIILCIIAAIIVLAMLAGGGR